MSLSLDQILSANDSAVEKVSCPEWGGDVYIRTLTADERDDLDNARAEGRGVRSALVGAVLCSEDGTPLKPTDAQVAGLGKKSTAPMERILDAALALNKMRPGDLEDTAKNSEPTDEPG